MTPIFKNFPAIIEDNESSYYSSLVGIIESVDALASVLITKRITGITIRILTSNSSYINSVIKEVNGLNTLFGIRVEFSKSIKSSTSINFSIEKLSLI